MKIYIQKWERERCDTMKRSPMRCKHTSIVGKATTGVAVDWRHTKMNCHQIQHWKPFFPLVSLLPSLSPSHSGRYLWVVAHTMESNIRNHYIVEALPFICVSTAIHKRIYWYRTASGRRMENTNPIHNKIWGRCVILDKTKFNKFVAVRETPIN